MRVKRQHARLTYIPPEKCTIVLDSFLKLRVIYAQTSCFVSRILFSIAFIPRKVKNSVAGKFKQFFLLFLSISVKGKCSVLRSVTSMSLTQYVFGENPLFGLQPNVQRNFSRQRGAGGKDKKNNSSAMSFIMFYSFRTTRYKFSLHNTNYFSNLYCQTKMMTAYLT